MAPSSSIVSLFRFDPAYRQGHTAIIASFSVTALLVGTVLIPNLLAPRYHLWGIHSARNALNYLWTGSLRRKRDKKVTLEKWMASEREFAWQQLLKNIGPADCDPGCVVASPSKVDPDYWYQWTRDSAMVFKVVIEYWKRDLHPGGSDATHQLIMDYITETKKMQRLDTPCGGFKTGGLGEVKYHTDGTPYLGSWSRPQNDGPALRAMALIAFANALLDQSFSKWTPFVRKELYDGLDYKETQSVIKADLDYICEVWHEPCWDLWEEVKGLHHFNMLVTLRALLDGSAFAARLKDKDSAELYKNVALKIESGLNRFWDADKGYLLGTIEPGNKNGKIGWLDTATVLGYIHSGSPSTFNHWLGSDRSLASTLAIGQSMRDVYRLNHRYYSSPADHEGYAVGRYCEDVYDGDGKIKTGKGNPWYLCTLAHAEFYYRLVPYFRNRIISINSVNETFFMDLAHYAFADSATREPICDGQSYEPGSGEHWDLLKAFKDRGDAFVSVVKDNACWDGGLWEQFDRDNGRELGAPNLTWSYAAFLTCMAAREGKPMYD